MRDQNGGVRGSHRNDATRVKIRENTPDGVAVAIGQRHPSTRHLPSRAARDFLPSINASQVTRGRLMSGHDFRPGAVPQFFRLR